MKKKEYLQHEFNGSFDAKNSKVPVQDKLMQLSTVELQDGSVVVSSDITLIFNQQRLENKLTASELREYIQRYTPNKSVYTAQLDDDTLLSTLKSRHIQSLSLHSRVRTIILVLTVVTCRISLCSIFV
jgi:hypothetical protein